MQKGNWCLLINATRYVVDRGSGSIKLSRKIRSFEMDEAVLLSTMRKALDQENYIIIDDTDVADLFILKDDEDLALLNEYEYVLLYQIKNIDKDCITIIPQQFAKTPVNRLTSNTVKEINKIWKIGSKTSFFRDKKTTIYTDGRFEMVEGEGSPSDINPMSASLDLLKNMNDPRAIKKMIDEGMLNEEHIK